MAISSPTILRKSRAVPLVLGRLFFLSCYRAGRVTAFAGNIYLILPSIPARVATVFFGGAHHTVAWNVRTRALLRVIHQFLSKIVVNEKDLLMTMPACPPQVPNWQNCRRKSILRSRLVVPIAGIILRVTPGHRDSADRRLKDSHAVPLPDQQLGPSKSKHVWNAVIIQVDQYCWVNGSYTLRGKGSVGFVVTDCARNVEGGRLCILPRSANLYNRRQECLRQSDRAGNRDAFALGQSLAEAAGARSDRGECAQAATDQENRRKDDRLDAGLGAAGPDRSRVAISGEAWQRAGAS
jgi:hypothetical protein